MKLAVCVRSVAMRERLYFVVHRSRALNRLPPILSLSSKGAFVVMWQCVRMAKLTCVGFRSLVVADRSMHDRDRSYSYKGLKYETGRDGERHAASVAPRVYLSVRRRVALGIVTKLIRL